MDAHEREVGTRESRRLKDLVEVCEYFTRLRFDFLGNGQAIVREVHRAHTRNEADFTQHHHVGSKPSALARGGDGHVLHAASSASILRMRSHATSSRLSAGMSSVSMIAFAARLPKA